MAFVSSRLLRTEVTRVLRRDDRPLSDRAPLLDRVGLFDISRETHTVAEPIERHVKTLDALHLATALLVGESVTLATHDRTMKTVAEHLGLTVHDPVRSAGSSRACWPPFLSLRAVTALARLLSTLEREVGAYPRSIDRGYAPTRIK